MGQRKTRVKNLLKLSDSIIADINEIYMCTEVPAEQPYVYLKKIHELTEGLLKALEMEGRHNDTRITKL